MKSTDELINDLKKQDQTSFLENETDYVQSGGAYLSKLLKEHHLQPGNLIRDLELGMLRRIPDPAWHKKAHADPSTAYRLLSTAVPIRIPAHAVHLPACYPVSEEPV